MEIKRIFNYKNRTLSFWFPPQENHGPDLRNQSNSSLYNKYVGKFNYGCHVLRSFIDNLRFGHSWDGLI